MGSLKDIANQGNRGTFPGATFEIVGEVPESQCSEAKIQGDNAITRPPAFQDLQDPGAFTGFALTGKICHITASVGGNTGDFNITGHDNDFVFLATNPGAGDPVEYHISDGGTLIITRDLKSFSEFIETAGYAYTIKGGKLYTNIPSPELQPACSILFDPLT